MAAENKLILLTGGNSGIGLEACKILCAEGHKVIATVRSDDKGQHCLSEVRTVCPDADIHYMLCELSDPNSIRQLVEKFRATWLTDGTYLDILINNAGLSPPPGKERAMSEYNAEWELTMAVNCLAPVLLTDLLIDSLKQTAAHKGEARVVMVNSSVILTDNYIKYQTDLDDPMMAKPGLYTGPIQAYKNSKASLMMCTLAMVDELQGTGVKVNSMCPGVIPDTSIGRHGGTCSMCCFKCMIKSCCCCCVKPQTNEQGGAYIVDMATHERGNANGLFFVRGDLKDPPPQCQDKQKQVQMLSVVRGYTSAQKM